MDVVFRNKLFEIIRSVFEPNYSDSQSLTLSIEEIESLMNFSMRQSLFPVIYQGIRNIVKSDADNYLANWEKEYLKCHYDYMQRLNTLREVSEIFEQEKIPYLPLKWSQLRKLYPEEWMRTSSDVDILVHEADLERAIQTIEEKLDFNSISRSFHDVSMMNSRMHLELHFSILANNERIDPLLDRVWEFSSETSGKYQYNMSPEYLVAYIVAHMSNHMIHGGVGIRPYLDLWLLNNHTNYNDEVLNVLLSEAGLKKYYEKSLEMVDSWMSGLPQSSVVMNLERFCLRGGVFGDSISSAAANQRRSRGIRYFKNRIIQNKKVLQEEYPLLKKRPYLNIYYQGKRWMRLLKREKRTTIRKEIRGLSIVKKADIKEYDRLLESVGL